mgnify:CR=1 FL=1
MNKKKKTEFRKFWTLFICLIIVYSVGFLGNLMAAGNSNSDWYESVKPDITPPGFLFPVVWNILFFFIAIALFIVWRQSKKQDKKEIIWVFGLNFVLNILWSFFYFGLRNPSAGLVDIVLLWVSILLMLHLSIRIDKRAYYLLLSYLAWVSFAGVLNYLSV